MSKVLELAKRKKFDEVFKRLDDGDDPNVTDGFGNSLPFWAIHHGDLPVLEKLAAKGVDFKILGDDLGLLNAAFNGRADICSYLLKEGADPNHRNQNGETVLHAAICKKENDASTEVVRILLEASADPNVATIPGKPTDSFMRDVRTRGETPLHRAAAFGSSEMIDLLIKHGAKKETLDHNGDSPLSWASWYLRDRIILRRLAYGEYRL